MPPASLSSDLRSLLARMTPHWLLKTVGITAFITLFFNAYFWLLKNPSFPVTVMPFTVIDACVPFTPWTLALYFSLWVYVPLAPVALPDKKQLYALGWEAGGVALAGLAIFFFWPTTIPPIAIDWSQHPGFAFLKTVDAAGNACPSLHVAFAVFTAIRFHESLRIIGARKSLHLANWVWCLGIVYSTLSTRQHVFVDALAGAALGTLGGCWHWTRLISRSRVP